MFGQRTGVQVRYLGVRGLMGSRLLPEVQFYSSLDRALQILVMHAGRTDLEVKTTRDILWYIKLNFLRP